MQQLYTCLYIPDFSRGGTVCDRSGNRSIPPVAVYTGTAPNCFVYAANQVARAGGVKEGMPLAEAKARFAALKNSSCSTGGKSDADDSKSRGIRPYRLRPASPMAGRTSKSCLSVFRAATVRERSSQLASTSRPRARHAVPLQQKNHPPRSAVWTDQRFNRSTAHGSRLTVSRIQTTRCIFTPAIRKPKNRLSRSCSSLHLPSPRERKTPRRD